IRYDYLVLANGVTTNFFGTPGAKEHAFAMYSRSQALKIRDTLFVRLEKSAASPGTDDGPRVIPSRLMNGVVLTDPPWVPEQNRATPGR
ncbi:hypothetical protein ACFVRU_44000, partial [Streptomyces sp. NPDC057927]